MARDLNLDVDAPDKVAAILRSAAEAFYESHGELQSAWQDKHAGREWSKIARILERAADQIDKAIGTKPRPSANSPGWDAIEADEDEEWEFVSRINGDHDNLDGVFLMMCHHYNIDDYPMAGRLARAYRDWLDKGGRTPEGYSRSEASDAVRDVLTACDRAKRFSGDRD